MGVCLLCVGQVVCENKFSLCPSHRNNMEEKTYPAMDLPVYGEANGANFISVEE